MLMGALPHPGSLSIEKLSVQKRAVHPGGFTMQPAGPE
jgi:hypothetical protein